MRIGILGGTFDPIHIAHLIIAEEARLYFSLEKVVFVPTGEPWLRPEAPVTQGKLRLQMVRLAVSSNPFFRVSATEIERPGPTYTVDTIDILRDEWGTEAEVYFIMGMDALNDLPRWKEPERFLELCTPVVFARSKPSRSALKELAAQLPGLKEKIRYLDGPAMGISGTDIRGRIAQGVSIRYLVPLDVEQFIVEHNLYSSVVKTE